jgi:hypothetical protein
MPVPVVLPAKPPERKPQRIKHKLTAGCSSLEKKILARRDATLKIDPDARVPTHKTIKMQFARVDVLYRALHDKPFDCKDFAWALNHQTVLAFIDECPQWKCEESRNAYRSALASILRNLEGFEEVAKIYGKATRTAKDTIIQPQNDKNALSARDREKYMPWEAVVECVARAPEGSQDAALMAVYCYMPPRRVQDFEKMYVTTAKDLRTLPKDRNYVQIQDSMPCVFEYNVYKTSKTYGSQEIDIFPALKPVLAAFVKKSKKRDGDLLFVTKDRNFSRHLTQTFARYTGKKLTADLLRRAYVTQALGARPTLADRKSLARLMAHSVPMQMEYEVLDDLENL